MIISRHGFVGPYLMVYNDDSRLHLRPNVPIGGSLRLPRARHDRPPGGSIRKCGGNVRPRRVRADSMTEKLVNSDGVRWGAFIRRIMIVRTPKERAALLVSIENSKLPPAAIEAALVVYGRI